MEFLELLIWKNDLQNSEFKMADDFAEKYYVTFMRLYIRQLNSIQNGLLRFVYDAVINRLKVRFNH